MGEQTSGTPKPDQKRSGLFDGFEGYRTPTEEDYRHVLTNGVVIPDANVLLNLYRYNPATQKDLFSVFEKLGDRLWIPNQALLEFWRNRESALRDPQDVAETTTDALDDQCRQAAGAIRVWANRRALSAERLASMVDAIEAGFLAAKKEIRELTDSDAFKTARDTNRDSLLVTLQAILTGRVGSKLSEVAHAAALKEGTRRVQAGLPPGFRDKSKAEDLACGDYILWEQVLCEAESRGCDVLLVTGDLKEDWWRKEHGESRGPRLELIDEFARRAHKRLFMLRPESLLVHAARVLQVDVREESVQDAERVERVQSNGDIGGWTPSSLLMLMDQLEREGPVQAAAIRWAVANGGFVGRDQVYELGGYEEDRTMRGFTRPVRRITQELRARGLVADDAIGVLEAVYDAAFSYVQAAGFRVPFVLIPLLRTQEAE